MAQTAQEWGWAITQECSGNNCTAAFQRWEGNRAAETALAAQGLRGRTFPHILLVLLLPIVNLPRQPQLRLKWRSCPVQDKDISLAKFALFTHCRIALCSPIARTKLQNTSIPQNREQVSNREAVLIYFQSKPYQCRTPQTSRNCVVKPTALSNIHNLFRALRAMCSKSLLMCQQK